MAENEEEVVEVPPVTEEVVQEDAPATLTQEQVDEIVAARVNEVREQSAQELRALREQAEQEIYRIQQASRNIREGSASDIEDDPAPQGMTRDEAIMWAANKQNRLHFKRQVQQLEDKLSRVTSPLITDSTVTNFFRGKEKVPVAVKERAAILFKTASSDPKMRGADSDQLMEASYVRALADHAHAQIFGEPATQNGQASGKKQPNVRAPNGSEFGGGTRPIIGKIGAGKKNETYQEIRASLEAAGKFPEDPL